MKKNFASQSFALLTAGLMMISSVACSTAPVQEEAPISESSATAVEPALDQQISQAPVTEDLMQDTVSGSTSDPMSAPSSLGASSSGRGH